MKLKLKICGVYVWTNLTNNKKYVGISQDIYKRWHTHEKLSKDITQRRRFYKAIRKYGVDDFKKEILETFEVYDAIELKGREDFYINLYDCISNGYNNEIGYNTITNHPDLVNIKKTLSDKAKHRRWINNGEIGMTCDIDSIPQYLEQGWVYGRRKFSDEHIAHLIESHMGYVPTDATRKKLSKLSKGRKYSIESRSEFSKNTQGRYTLKWYIEKWGDFDGNIRYIKHHFFDSRFDIYVNDGDRHKRIKKEELAEYISNGWLRGRLKKIKK